MEINAYIKNWRPFKLKHPQIQRRVCSLLLTYFRLSLNLKNQPDEQAKKYLQGNTLFWYKMPPFLTQAFRKKKLFSVIEHFIYYNLQFSFQDCNRNVFFPFFVQYYSRSCPTSAMKFFVKTVPRSYLLTLKKAPS